MAGNYQLNVVGILGLSVKLSWKDRSWWTYLIEKIGKGEDKITGQGIDWILLEERLLPSKYNKFWNHFKGRVLCQGWGDWESRLHQSNN